MRWNETDILRLLSKAEQSWGNLKQYYGMHWYSSFYLQSLNYNWKLYDPEYVPNIPNLSDRFPRSICSSPHADPLEENKLLRVVLFYMKTNSQSLYMSSIDPDTIRFIITSINPIITTKKIDKDIVIIYK